MTYIQALEADARAVLMEIRQNGYTIAKIDSNSGEMKPIIAGYQGKLSKT